MSTTDNGLGRSRPLYAVLNRDREDRRRARFKRQGRDTAPLARTGKPTKKLSLAESITRDTVEEMLAERRKEKTSNQNGMT